jgi:response regulator RpfG family c-di-GMP phosphodiesterase
VYQTVLIGNDSEGNALKQNKITQNGICNSCKVSVNAGIALLYLQQQAEEFKNLSRLIIIDINTPIMNGFEFLSELRNSKTITSANTMIIAIKDKLNMAQLDKLKIMGVHNFIEEDFCPQLLTDIVKEHFHKKIKNNSNSSQKNLQGYAA